MRHIGVAVFGDMLAWVSAFKDKIMSRNPVEFSTSAEGTLKENPQGRQTTEKSSEVSQCV